MPVSYRILPDLSLVHVTYSGQVGLVESQAQKLDCIANPAFRPWMRHLVDMSGMTGYDRNFVGQMAVQAASTGMFPDIGDLLIVFYAPSRVAQELAHIARRSWEGLDQVAVMIVAEEEIALSVLALPGSRLADLDTAAR